MRPAPGAPVSTRGPKATAAVEDVAGQDRLDVLVEVGRVGELERGQQRDDRARVVAQLHGDLRLDDQRAVVQRHLGAVLEQPV